MRAFVFTSVLAALPLIAGCVPTLNAVYTEEDLVFDEAVLGTWKQGNSQATWKFTRRGDKEYLVVYTDKSGEQGRFVAHLADVQGTRFLDLYPDEIEIYANDFYKGHLVPIHSAYLVSSTKPDLKLVSMDLKWLKEYLAENPDALQSATVDNRFLVTAPTRKLQEFLVKHKDRFIHDINLVRVEE